jgi:hypothetical protein
MAPVRMKLDYPGQSGVIIEGDAILVESNLIESRISMQQSDDCLADGVMRKALPLF